MPVPQFDASGRRYSLLEYILRKTEVGCHLLFAILAVSGVHLKAWLVAEVQFRAPLQELHGSVRRFTSPDEHAFYPEAVPSLVLPPLKYPEVSRRPAASRTGLHEAACCLVLWLHHPMLSFVYRFVHRISNMP